MGYQEWRARIKRYGEITDYAPICRRYFVIGAFDGTLTILGLILGAFFAGADKSDVPLIVGAGVSAAIALAISSVAGAYEAERIEKKLDQKKMERALLTSVGQEHRDAFRFVAWISAIVHGMAPLIAAAIPLFPFYFVPDYLWATLGGSILGFTILFIIGVYMGKLAEEFSLYTGLRFVLVGFAMAAIIIVLGHGI